MTIVRLALVASAAALTGACRGRPAVAPDPRAIPAPAPLQTLRADQVFILEHTGTEPGDTVAAIVPGAARTVVLRHASPDNTVFATVAVPAAGFSGAGDTVHLTLRPRPGVYGLDVAADATFGPGIVLTFKYAVHFAAPAAAIERYRHAPALERRLSVARRNADGSFTLLASGRPASDNLAVFLSAPGSYYVVAPR
ncbi:MAG TPA: hypothetical protein VFS28_04115 [Gemmatimonadales bacterium]|nr:hypothetical protein [Gemmatimonadales bacterium]